MRLKALAVWWVLGLMLVLRAGGEDALVAQIDLPKPNSLVKGDVPLFGTASGSDFDYYDIELGQGSAPQTWKTIYRNHTRQVNETFNFLPGNGTIYGNLATWFTGLHNYRYPPSSDYPDLTGIYTLKLVVNGKSGQRAEAAVALTAGCEIPYCIPAECISEDRRVFLEFPEFSVRREFVIFAICSGVPPASRPFKNQAGPVYEIFPPGERLLRPAELQFDYGYLNLPPERSARLRILVYDKTQDDWRSLPGGIDKKNQRVYARLQRLPFPRALYALGEETPERRCPEIMQLPEPGGTEKIAGRAARNTRVQLFANGNLLGETRSGPYGGLFEFDPGRLPAGQSNLLRVASLDAEGRLQDLSPEYKTVPCEPAACCLPEAPVISSETNGNLCFETFEKPLAACPWQGLDGQVGAELLRNEQAAASGKGCLELVWNSHKTGRGNFGAVIRDSPFTIDGGHFQILQFDYKISAGIEENFYFKLNGHWYELRFTHRQGNRYLDQNIYGLGEIPGIKRDGQWHQARVNLFDLFHRRFPNQKCFLVDKVQLANWELGGYKQLLLGENLPGSRFYLDNFIIASENFSSQVKLGWNQPGYKTAGFTYSWDRNPVADPPGDTLFSKTNLEIPAQPGVWYFHLRAVTTDKLLSETAHFCLINRLPAEGGGEPGALAVLPGGRKIASGGLEGSYFADKESTALRGKRLDGPVDFNWTEQGPGFGIPTEKYSVVWKGWLEIPADGVYKFSACADDFVVWTLNGRVILDSRQEHNYYPQAVVRVKRGFQPVEVRLIQGVLQAEVHLYWESDSVPKELIPAKRLYHLYPSGSRPTLKEKVDTKI